ncbi:hypothetical protein [uncultured Oscillibacter sp.]|nr:hypothetical protein [uncultured Oscillibacter sp.]
MAFSEPRRGFILGQILWLFTCRFTRGSLRSCRTAARQTIVERLRQE